MKYPEYFREKGIESKIILELWIDKNGIIRNIVVIDSTYDDFANAAIEAFKDIKYTSKR